MIRLAWALALGLLPALALAQTPYPEVPANPGFDAVLALPSREPDRDIQYGDDPNQFAWLWLPRQRQTRALLIFIHGGCWSNEYGVGHVRAAATALAAEGFAVWAPEYRRSGDAGGGWPGSINDIHAAIEFTRGQGGEALAALPYALVGHSAGAHLALLAAARRLQSADQPELVVALAGISDLIRYARGNNGCQRAAPLFMGGDPESLPRAYRDANPVSQTLPANTWLLQGAADDIVPLEQSRVSGTRRLVVDGAGHFDWVHPGTPAFAELLELLEASLP